MHNLMVSPGRVAQSVGLLTRKSGVLGSIPGLATYFHFSFCFFKKGSCQLLAKVCASHIFSTKNIGIFEILVFEILTNR